MIDTHAHLADPSFDKDLDDVVARARNAGVTACIVVGELPGERDKIRAIEKRYPGWAFGGLGIFPSSYAPEDVEAFRRLSEQKWVCFGEVGMDTWLVQDEEERLRDESLFLSIVERAKSLDIPVNVHSRNCGKRVIELLIASGHSRVHLHAFDAKPSTIRLGIEAGFYFSVPASIVHSPQKQKLARLVPVEQMLFETDAPVLGPDRASRNEPANIRLALHAVAELRDMDPVELETITDANARKLYKL